ncbi:hypothetical protein RCL1_002028 [Eukaryota sp. TZLM3-RCL]
MTDTKCFASKCDSYLCDFRYIEGLNPEDKGSYGDGYIAQDHSGRRYFVKTVSKSRSGAQEELARFLTPIDSPYIIQYLHCFETEREFYFVMPLCQGGSLFRFIYNSRQQDKNFSLSKRDVMSIFVQLLSALRSLHNTNIIHRDLKLGNILLERACSPFKILLCDFGISKSTVNAVCQTVIGTPGYIAPEVEAKQPYGIAVDYFSLGCVLYELTEKKRPFPLISTNSCDFQTDFSVPLVTTDSNPFTRILQGLLELDPKKRLGFETLMDFQEVRSAYETIVGPVLDSYSMKQLLKSQSELEQLRLELARKESLINDQSSRINRLEGENEQLKKVQDSSQSLISSLPSSLPSSLVNKPAFSQSDSDREFCVYVRREFGVYVGDLPSSITETDLRSVFSDVGEISSVRIVSYPGRPFAHAYLNFKLAQSSDVSIDHLNGHVFDDKPCTVDLFLNRLEVARSNPLLRKNVAAITFIRGLPKSLSSRRLYHQFSPYGTIVSAKITNESLGFGFVRFENEQDAKKALECTCITLENGEQHSIIVEPFKPPTKRYEIHQGVKAINSIFIKNLDLSVTEEELLEVCSQFGTISSHDLKVSPQGGLKYAIVAYVKEETLEDKTTKTVPCIDSAIQAIKALNNTTLLKTPSIITVTFFMSKPARFQQFKREFVENTRGRNLWIGNLPIEFEQDDLKNLFEKFGQIKTCGVHPDKTGKPRKTGFVLFDATESAFSAMRALNGQLVGSSTDHLSIGIYKTKQQMEADKLRRVRAGSFPSYLERIARPYPVSLPGMRPTRSAVQRIPTHMFPYSTIVPRAAQITVPAAIPAAPVAVPRAQPEPSVEDERLRFIAELEKIENEEERKAELGEQLYALVYARNADAASNITGMFLQLDWDEVKNIYLDDSLLVENIQEAEEALREAQ